MSTPKRSLFLIGSSGHQTDNTDPGGESLHPNSPPLPFLPSCWGTDEARPRMGSQQELEAGLGRAWNSTGLLQLAFSFHISYCWIFFFSKSIRILRT